VTTSSLRVRRRQETTTTIAEAALDLAVERGWSSVTVDDVAEAAGISRRTFFNYFPTKDEALLHLAASWDAGLLTAFSGSSGPVLDALEDLVVAQTEQQLLDRDRGLRVMRLVEGTPELLPGLLARFAVVERDLAAALRARDPGRDPVQADVLAACVGAVLRVASTTWLTGSTDPDPVATLRRAFSALRTVGA
jgi:AcrR family transcriptional regulator